MKKLVVALVLIVSLFCSTTLAFGAADPSVTIVNPVSNSTVYADNLLISIKVTATKTIKITVYEEKLLNADGSVSSLDTLDAINEVDADSLRHAVVMPTETFLSNGSLSFYTKQVNSVTPGLYKIRAVTVDSGGKTLYSSDTYVVVRAPSEAQAVVFESQQSGVLSFLQNFLKNIFGN
ncbi:MAG: hypothetical protein Q4C22_07510 [Bacillota bacterium]|nr:hypothetical protein [Bacillota bacterium]